MLENLAKEFLTSTVANEAVGALKNEAGLDHAQASQALSATAEGAVQALGNDGGVAGLLGGLAGGGAGGLGGMLGGLMGGSNAPAAGGLGGMLGGLMGGGSAPAAGGLGGMLGGLVGGGASSGLPPQLVDTVANVVAEKTGLGIDKARLAVNVVLPKLIAFAKEKFT